MILQVDNTDSVIAWLCDGVPPTRAYIDIAKLTALISKALQEDGLDHDPNEILEIILNSIGNSAGLSQQARIFITAADIFLHGSDWIIAIAEHFGFRGVTDDFVDTEWMDGRPHIKAVYRAMTMLAVRAMGAASDVYEQQNGHSMMDVFLGSLDTGEDLDQTQRRLSAKTNGLRAVT